MKSALNVILTYSLSELATCAQRLAAQWGLPLVAPGQKATSDAVLTLTPHFLELSSPKFLSLGAVHLDFLDKALLQRCKRGSISQQALARAVGLHKTPDLTLLDLSAGLGRDAFMLSCWGAKVKMLERSAPAAALLADGLQRGQAYIAERQLSLELIFIDARNYLSELDPQAKPQVIYFDPMYPPMSKAALHKKTLRLWRTIVGDDVDADELLSLALNSSVKRVVVKRPRLAPSLGGRLPDYQLKGSSTRFDVYLIL